MAAGGASPGAEVDHDGYVRPLRQPTKGVEKIPTVHARHREIENDDAEVESVVQRVERFLTFARGDDPVTVSLQDLAHQLA